MYKQRVIVFVLFSLAACTKEEITPRDYPRVMTREVESIASGGATFKGEITFASAAIIDHGFIWSNGGFPTFVNANATKRSLGTKDGVGSFELAVTQGLQVGKKYSVCAYTKSSKDIVYGKTFDFVSK